MKKGLEDLQKAVAGGKAINDPKLKRTFVPATAQEIRRARAARVMNEPDVQEGWADLMKKMGDSFVTGTDVCECEVPKGGGELLSLLGYSVTFMHSTDEGEMVSVCLFDHFKLGKAGS